MTWLYKTDTNNTARFILGEFNNTLAKTLICVGINPSTATPNNLDPTLNKVQAIASNHNYENWVMINVYPQRATNPNNLHINLDIQLHSDNLNEIKILMDTFRNCDILFTYGNLIDVRPYLKSCLADILSAIDLTGFTGQKLCIKRTIKGNPIHPLYQKSNSVLVPY